MGQFRRRHAGLIRPLARPVRRARLATLLLLALPATARAAGFWSQPNLLGDPAGLRQRAAAVGLSFGWQDTDEVLGNLTGGTRREAAYDGLSELSLGLDTGRAFGLPGGTFNISALQIRGRNLSTDALDTLQTASGIEASPATRLWELWYQQSFWHGRADVKLGQQSIDQEFMVSAPAALFVNTMMGWPMLPSADLYAGGPAYPLSSLGIRLRLRPTPGITLLAGVFDDNPPAGPFANDPQTLGAEASGTRFSLATGALWIAELDWHRPGRWSGTWKLGGWYDSGTFRDQHVDNTGLSLANPASSGIPLRHRGDFSLYAVIDQTLLKAGDRRLTGFLRLMAAPPDRNLIAFSANGGLTLTAPFAARPNDTAGIGFGVAKVSADAAALDRDTAAFTGAFTPVQGTETFFELTYQAQITPWWVLQPDFQYVIDPGGLVANPNAPGQAVGDEAVIGLRSVITLW